MLRNSPVNLSNGIATFAYDLRGQFDRMLQRGMRDFSLSFPLTDYLTRRGVMGSNKVNVSDMYYEAP